MSSELRRSTRSSRSSTRAKTDSDHEKEEDHYSSSPKSRKRPNTIATKPTRTRSKVPKNGESLAGEQPNRRKKFKLSELPQLPMCSSSTTTSFNNASKKQSISPSRTSLNLKKEEEKKEEQQQQDGDQLWTEKHAPQSTSRVALHSRKLKDIKTILTPMFNRSTNNSDNTTPNLLIFTGPSGSSKSTIAKTLSQEYLPNSHPSFIEFLNPLNAKQDDISDFLTAAKYHRGKKHEKLILIEDLPNVHHEETRLKFQQALLHWCSSDLDDLPPLILCLTECEIPASDDNNINNNRDAGYGVDTSFTAETVLGTAILSHPKVRRVKFNPVNFTLCKKHLMEIAYNKEPKVFRKAKGDLVKEKIESLAKLGDLRSSISALQFWSTYLNQDDDEKSLSLDLYFGKEPPVNLFHAIGKTIYGSSSSSADSVKIVTEQFTTRSSLFKLGILENYDKFNQGKYDLKSGYQVAELLSWQDTLPISSLSLDITASGTRQIFSSSLTTSTSTSDSHTKSSNGSGGGLSFPRDFKSQRLARQTQTQIQAYRMLEFKRRKISRSFQDSNLLTGCWEPQIHNARLFKEKARVSYLRNTGQEVSLELLKSSEGQQSVITERLGGVLTAELHSEIESTFHHHHDITAATTTNLQYYRQTSKDNDDGLYSDYDSEDDDPLVDDPIADDSGDDNDSRFFKELGENEDDEEEFDRQLLALSQRPSKSQIEKKSSNNINSRSSFVEKERERKRRQNVELFKDVDFDEDWD